MGLWSIFRKFPLKAKPLLLLRMITWSIGWLALFSWFLLPYFLYPNFDFEIPPLGIVTSVGFLLLVSYYLIGAKETKTVFPAILLFPIYTSVEVLMPLYTLFAFRKVKSFEICDKS